MDRTSNNSALIGCRIKHLRQHLNLTQKQFSERLGITVSHISRVEHGIGNFSITLVRLISKVYSINEEWILTGKGEMLIPQCISEKSGECEQFIEELKNINNQISVLIQKMRSSHANDRSPEDE